MQINHIAIAVKDIEEAANSLEILGIVFESPVEVPEQQTRVAFGMAGELRIELIQAMTANSPRFPMMPHPVLSYLEKHGQGVHHIAFSVSDIQKALVNYAEQGILPLCAEPEQGAEGMVAFLDPRKFGGLLIELCEASKNES
ncbi:VOC family protein [Candidatus Pacearchaeota archaeon]|nr:VOC family protein [Candidatus Pacearchaeota archaeon]